METPYITHITSDDFKLVYEPAEDSFLLIDALESELDFLKESKPVVCVEIGSGSGIVITALAKALSMSACFGVDINPHACRVSQQTAVCNKVENVNIISMDLLTAFRKNTVDVLVFNPPYVVTPDDEINDVENTNNADSITTSSTIKISGDEANNQFICKSWAGGHQGRKIMDKVFIKLIDILTDNGVAYVLVIKDNCPEQIIEDLMTLNLNAKIIANRKIRGEHLFILKILKN